jgi:hypothetical protein
MGACLPGDKGKEGRKAGNENACGGVFVPAFLIYSWAPGNRQRAVEGIQIALPAAAG